MLDEAITIMHPTNKRKEDIIMSLLEEKETEYCLKIFSQQSEL